MELLALISESPSPCVYIYTHTHTLQCSDVSSISIKSQFQLLSLLFYPLNISTRQYSLRNNINMEVRSTISGVNNFIMIALLLVLLAAGALAQQCGRQAGGAVCPNRLCCSQFGYCGNTDPYCGAGCQSQCTTNTPTPTTPTGPTGDITALFPRSLFQEFLKHRGDGGCPGGFYTYDAFIAAARTFPAFLNTGDQATRKRELAAFFGQTSHETTGTCLIIRHACIAYIRKLLA